MAETLSLRALAEAVLQRDDSRDDSRDGLSQGSATQSDVLRRAEAELDEGTTAQPLTTYAGLSDVDRVRLHAEAEGGNALAQMIVKAVARPPEVGKRENHGDDRGRSGSIGAW
jgi:hypothetical protein